jgi:hypothetical protein
MKPGKEVMVNVNRMERCHSPPKRNKVCSNSMRYTVTSFSEKEYACESTEPPCIPGRPILVSVPHEISQDSGETGNENVTVDEPEESDDTTDDRTWIPGHATKEREGDNLG